MLPSGENLLALLRSAADRRRRAGRPRRSHDVVQDVRRFEEQRALGNGP